MYPGARTNVLTGIHVKTTKACGNNIPPLTSTPTVQHRDVEGTEGFHMRGWGYKLGSVCITMYINSHTPF